MAKGYDSHITLYENDGWYDSGTSTPIVPILEAEDLRVGKVISEKSTVARNTRSQLEDSLVDDSEFKPEGFITVIPRIENLLSVFMSHFQMISEVNTGSSYINTYVPLKKAPRYDGSDIYGDGTYGDEANDVYSIDIKKQFIENTTLRNVQHFKRGVCDKLTFSNSANSDLTVKADYKFKGVDFLSSSATFGDGDTGDYSTGSITDWSHGTWALGFDAEGTTVTELSSIDFTCSNNLLESKKMGSLERTSFDFGNYTVKGNFSTEYEDDSFFEQWQGTFFSVVGTYYHSNTEWMSISMPRCFLKAFDKKMEKPSSFLSADASFEAYEYQGTSPITVTTHSESTAPGVTLTYWDALNGVRTLSEFDLADAGSTTRTLGDYDFADRDI